MPIKPALSVLSCLAALFAHSSGHAAGGECEKRLRDFPALETRLITELQSRAASVTAWNVVSGQPLLAALNAEGQLDVFDPAKGGLPLTTVRTARAISRFEWEERGRGGLLVLQEGRELSLHQAVEQKAAELVDVVDLVFGDQVAIGTVGLARVRIMPVGSVGPGRDLRASSRPDGTPVTALATDSALRVYSAGSPEPGQIVLDVPLSQATEPHWIQGVRGEPVLLYVDSTSLVARFPFAGRDPLSAPVAGGSKLQVALQAGGEALVLAISPGSAESRVFELSGSGLRERATVARALRLFAGPGGAAHMVAVLDHGSDGKNQVRLAWLDDPSVPIFSLPIDSSEEVKSISDLALEDGRVLLAVATTRTIYVLELKASAPAEHQVHAP